MFLQANTITDLQNIVSTNNATVQGILIAVVLALGTAVIYMFKYIQRMNAEREVLYKEFIGEIKIFNTNLMNVNKDYHESITKISELYRKSN